MARTNANTPMRHSFDRIVARRGVGAKHSAQVAAARELLGCVYYTMRNGHVRSSLRT
jgi:hypothetical protein